MRVRTRTMITMLVAVAMLATLATPAFAHFNGNDTVREGTRDVLCVDFDTTYMESHARYAMSIWETPYGVDVREYGVDCSGNVDRLEIITINSGCNSGYASYYRKWYHDFGSLRLDTSCMGNLTWSQQRHVLVHEFGHALGLAHSYGSNVMAASGYWGYVPQTHDRQDYCQLWWYSSQSMCNSGANW